LRLVQVGALAGDGRVEGGGEGVVNYADYGREVDGEAERDGDVGVAVDEVRCAVYGVEDECGGWADRVAGLVGLLAHEFERGVSLVEGGEDELFDGLVGFCY